MLSTRPNELEYKTQIFFIRYTQTKREHAELQRRMLINNNASILSVKCQFCFHTINGGWKALRSHYKNCTIKSFEKKLVCKLGDEEDLDIIGQMITKAKALKQQKATKQRKRSKQKQTKSKPKTKVTKTKQTKRKPTTTQPTIIQTNINVHDDDDDDDDDDNTINPALQLVLEFNEKKAIREFCRYILPGNVLPGGHQTIKFMLTSS